MRPAAILILLALAARADEEAASYFVTRANRAMDDGDLDGARDWLEKSLAEKEGYLPALVSLADLAQRRGDRADAVRRLEECLAQGERRDLSEHERGALVLARDLLERIDSGRSEYRRLVSEHVAELIALARSSKRKNKELAQACYRTVLLLDPEHETALRMVAGESTPGRREVEGRPLFNGKDLKDWTGKGPAWKVKGRILIGKLADAANINRYRTEVAGDFAVTCEMRVVENLGDNPVFGLVIGLKDSYDHFGLWLWHDSISLARMTGENQSSTLQRRSLSRLRKPFDPGKWHRYRIERKGKRVIGYVDGEELWSFAGADRTLDGFLGLWVQEQHIEVRSFLLRQ